MRILYFFTSSVFVGGLSHRTVGVRCDLSKSAGFELAWCGPSGVRDLAVQLLTPKAFGNRTEAAEPRVHREIILGCISPAAASAGPEVHYY